MAISAPTNPDLPSSVLIPGVFLKLNLSSGGAGLNSPSKRLLLIGNKLASGTASQDTPVQVTNQTDANNFFGRGSDLARMFTRAVAQNGAGACDIFCLPVVEPASGTAATRLITFLLGPATASGFVSVNVMGQTVSSAIANGDNTTVIATNLLTQLQTLKDLPITFTSSTGTITATYAHKGLVGNDMPMIVNLYGATGVKVSPGTVTYAGTTSGGTVAATVQVGGTTISTAVANGDTPTTIGTNTVTSINGGAYPVTADNTAGQVNLYFVNDRVVNRIVGTNANSGITVATACGVLGAGSPTLTNALTNLQSQAAFPVWCTSFNDNNSSSTFHGGVVSNSIKTLATHINTYCDGYNQKGQRLFFGATEALATAGAYQTGNGLNTVAADGEARYVEIWQVDSPHQAYELAVCCAAAHIAKDYQPTNYAGQPLISKQATFPLMVPNRATRSGIADMNSAMLTYYMTPLAVDESRNVNYILRDRTTSPGYDQRLWSWGGIATLDYIRSDMNAFLSSRFSGKSFKAVSPPRTPNVVTAQSIRDAIAERLRSYDSIDFVDDIDSLVKAITANQDPIVTNRVDVFIPIKIPVALYQIAGLVSLS